MVRPRASPILMPVRKRRRIKARSRVLSMTRISFVTFLRVYRPGERVGKFEPHLPFQERQGEDVLIHEKVDEGDDGDEAGPHRRDVQAPVLFVLDECFEVGPYDLPNVAFPHGSVELKKQHDRGEGTFDRSWFVVYPPLVAQVVLEVLLRGKVHRGKPSKNMIDYRSLTHWFGDAAVRVDAGFTWVISSSF